VQAFQSRRPSSITASRSPSRRRLRRDARQAVGGAEAQHLRDPGGARAQAQTITGVRAPAFLPSALPSAGTFPVEFVIASTANHDEIVRFAQEIVPGGHEERPVRLPADHRRSHRSGEDRDRHRPRQGRLDGAHDAVGRRDLSSMLGGNFVNRFNIDGRSYKVIPQIERAGRLTPDQLGDIYRHRAQAVSSCR
jgi:multidrug efflux pump